MLALRARGGAANDGRAMGRFIDERVAAIPTGCRGRYRLWIRVDSAGYSDQVIAAAERRDATTADDTVTAKGYQKAIDDLDGWRLHAIIANISDERMTAAAVEAHHRLRGGIPEDTIRALKNDIRDDPRPGAAVLRELAVLDGVRVGPQRVPVATHPGVAPGHPPGPRQAHATGVPERPRPPDPHRPRDDDHGWPGFPRGLRHSLISHVSRSHAHGR